MKTDLNDISNVGIYEYRSNASNTKPEPLYSLTDQLKHSILTARNNGINDSKIAYILNMSQSQLHRFMNEKEEMPKSETS